MPNQKPNPPLSTFKIDLLISAVVLAFGALGGAWMIADALNHVSYEGHANQDVRQFKVTLKALETRIDTVEKFASNRPQPPTVSAGLGRTSIANPPNGMANRFDSANGPWKDEPIVNPNSMGLEDESRFIHLESMDPPATTSPQVWKWFESPMRP